MTATERFKAIYANAVEQVCVLQEQLEKAQARIEELEKQEESDATRNERAFSDDESSTDDTYGRGTE